MAIKLATTFKGIPLSEAYNRVVSVNADRDQGYVYVRYGVWQDDAAAVVILPSREAIDLAETELQTFAAARKADVNYQTGLDVRNRHIDDLKRTYQESIKTAMPVLEHLTEVFPYEPDVTVAKAYSMLKTRAKFTGAVDV